MEVKKLRGWFGFTRQGLGACTLVLGTMLLIAAVGESSTMATVGLGILAGASYRVAIDIIVSIVQTGDL